ncbi:trypsin-like isoform X1 [Leguminivora glycinivorella]|uniref:trypsin-like isoform X1 n=2 Tax=Leguminivora glycinivorella TaxID=1035111 RepID=UPI002010C42F|nr:trypsin-like isoform X1 [Leguminivora glycinivorella]
MSSVAMVLAILSVLLVGSVLQVAASDDLTQRIIGGHMTDIEDAPWMAALWTANKDGNTSFCGGSIVHEQFILTAAHCFRNADEPFNTWGYICRSNLFDEGIFIKPEQKFCHDDFQFPSHANDICLLKLKDPITKFNDKIALITFDDTVSLEPGTMVNVTGWGKTENSKGAVEDMRQVLVPIRSDTTCRKNYPSTTEKQICAGNKGHDSCVGDSGGPLTWYNIQVGIVSYGRGCGQPNGAVYVRVNSYLEWIATTIHDNL